MISGYTGYRTYTTLQGKTYTIQDTGPTIPYRIQLTRYRIQDLQYLTGYNLHDAGRVQDTEPVISYRVEDT